MDGPFWTITQILLCQVVWEYIDVYYTPCVDVVWLEPPAFEEELVKYPTFLNFADPILHNNVVKDIFAWVYRVGFRVSLEIIGIGYKSSEMDSDRYSGKCLFKVEADTGAWAGAGAGAGAGDVAGAGAGAGAGAQPVD